MENLQESIEKQMATLDSFDQQKLLYELIDYLHQFAKENHLIAMESWKMRYIQGLKHEPYPYGSTYCPIE